MASLNFINSGSDGNSAILTDSQGNQILLDCGVDYKKTNTYINFKKLSCLLITHYHNDHCKYKKNYELVGVDIYEPYNIKSGELIDIPFWRILPMQLVHNIECFGFLIYSKIDKKKIAYITDTTYIPQISNMDCLVIDTNYDEDIIFEQSSKNAILNNGYIHHLSVQQVVNYLNGLNYKVPKVICSHLSNSGHCDSKKILKMVSKYCDDVHIANKNLIIEI